MLNALDVLVLDTSGSMGREKDAYASALTEYFNNLKEDPNANHTLIVVEFDTDTRVVAKGVPLKQYTFPKYDPLGSSTNLYDAIYVATDTADDFCREEAKQGRNYELLLIVLSDGQHNVVHGLKHSKKDAQAKITDKENTGYWRVAYLGANQDAWAEAEAVGIKSAYNYTADAQGIMAMADALSTSTRSYTSRVAKGEQVKTEDFWDIPEPDKNRTKEQRAVLSKLAKLRKA